MIRESLRDKRVLLTGATGFLGAALLERLVFDVGVARVELLVRGEPRSRLEWLAAGALFGPARQRLGGRFDQVLRELVGVHSADLAQGRLPPLPEVDLVIHAAATVEFDSGIDVAFATNLLGSVALCEAARGLPFLHVSTTYVADLRDGVQLEAPLAAKADWRREADAAAAVLGNLELESRAPAALERFLAQARRELAKAGQRAVARRAEELRAEWLRAELVRAGRSRAQALGWSDVYAFTKALAEMALDEVAGDAPLTIVRPSIIESAVRHPYPGWIEGFRMADPVILGYGRGSFPEFPGSPVALLDLIPVDMVVNAILAAASTMSERRRILHVCSGRRNPLRVRDAYEQMRRFFLAHPLPVPNRGTVRVPEWRFPGTRAVRARLAAADKLLRGAESLVRLAPGVEVPRELRRRRRQLELLSRYADLYGPYVQTEVVFDDRSAQALEESLPAAERRDFSFDASGFGWDDYFQDVYLPAITALLRWPAAQRHEPRVTVTRRKDESANALAVFDVEGTIVATNVIETYLTVRTALTPGVVPRMKALAALAGRLPALLGAERRDRSEFLELFYREYTGAQADELRRLALEPMREHLLRKLAPCAVRRIREHRAAGHHVVLITGSLDILMTPLRALADEVVAAELEERDGRFTGQLRAPPLVTQLRAAWLRDRARALGVDLELSYAYGDSLSDLPMLEEVGMPVAVNPEPELRELARRRGWPIEDWRAEGATARFRVPSSSRA